MNVRARFTVVLLALAAIAAAPLGAAAQDFGFEPPADANDPALVEAMRDLAERLLPAYRENDPDEYLSTLAALQMVVGDPPAAQTTRRTLRERLEARQSTLPPGRAFVYDIYTEARAIEAAEKVEFTTAYERAFENALGGISDLQAYDLQSWFTAPLEPLRQAVQRLLDRRRGTGTVPMAEALELVQTWFAFEAYRSFGALARPLLEEDKARRYVAEDVAIPVASEASISATVVRPRTATETGTVPALLEFTLDRSTRDPYEAAAHGYGSVLALARIAGDPASRPRAPFESEADDAWAAIAWIAQQPWSDGRVGMQGSRYGGFVAWAAARRSPPALKAIATFDPMAPGIDMPSRGRIVLNSSYRWVYSLLAPPDDPLARDDARWRAIDEEWYRSGRIYRDFPQFPGRARAVFRSWLNHPSFDRFWQKWLPSPAELAALEIPALTVTGYYSPGQTGALYYYTQHVEHDADAEHALLVGPFDEQSLERAASAELRGLTLDPAARIVPREVRYAWFEHAFGGTEPPPLARPGVNFAPTGADAWRHAPSLADIERRPLRLYLDDAPDGPPHALVPEPSAEPLALTTTVNLTDRGDADWRPVPQLVLRDVVPRTGFAFVSAPFDAPVELAGRARGLLDITVSKYDVDLAVMLYELRASGEYVKLFEPAYAFRASYARDRVHRRLLPAGVRVQLPWQSEQLVGHTLQAGSRLVLTLEVNKRADQQINYGATRDVSEESIEDAGAPLRIRWHEGSYIEAPIFEAPSAVQ